MCVVLLTYRHFTLMGVVWANRHLTIMVSSLYLFGCPLSFSGRMQERPQSPSHRHSFRSFWQSASTEHFRIQVRPLDFTCNTHTHSDHLGLFRGNTCTYTLGSFRIIHGKYLHTYTLGSFRNIQGKYLHTHTRFI